MSREVSTFDRIRKTASNVADAAADCEFFGPEDTGEDRDIRNIDHLVNEIGSLSLLLNDLLTDLLK